MMAEEARVDRKLMEKYKRVQRPKEQKSREPDASTAKDGEMLISGYGRTQNYIAYAAKVFLEDKKRELVVKATGMAMPTAVATVEIIKRRIKGLSQVTKLGSYEVEDEYEPLEDGLELMTRKRQVTFMEIVLSLDGLDEAQPGFQGPLDESLVQEVDDMKTGPPKKEGSSEESDEKRPRSKKGGRKGSKSKGGKKGDKKDGKKGEGKKSEKKGEKKEESEPKDGEAKKKRSRKGRGRGKKGGEDKKEESKSDE